MSQLFKRLTSRKAVDMSAKPELFRKTMERSLKDLNKLSGQSGSLGGEERLANVADLLDAPLAQDFIVFHPNRDDKGRFATMAKPRRKRKKGVAGKAQPPLPPGALSAGIPSTEELGEFLGSGF